MIGVVILVINLHSLYRIEMEPPAELLVWLQYTESLTQRLHHLAGEAEVALIGQRWHTPSWWDKYILGIDKGPILEREICMMANQQPCWYARTVIPQASYQRNAVFFDRLQTESLNALIFDTPETQRVNSTYYPLDATCLEYYWVAPRMLPLGEKVWLRLAEYCYAQQSPFFLMEILLPAIRRYS